MRQSSQVRIGMPQHISASKYVLLLSAGTSFHSSSRCRFVGHDKNRDVSVAHVCQTFGCTQTIGVEHSRVLTWWCPELYVQQAVFLTMIGGLVVARSHSSTCKWLLLRAMTVLL